MRSWVKILCINLLVMVGIFVIAEFGLRAYSTFKLCLKGKCDGELFTTANFFHENMLIGLSTTDPVLGYKPNPGFNGIVHYPPGWDHVYVSIDSNGFRRNTDDNTNDEHSGEKVLTVGDSFTFGDQVNNSNTWPACIAQKTGFDVWNGGVFGYGAAQAVLRAEQEVARHGPFDTIIWGVTVISDFARDQMKVRANFPKPYVATVAGETKFAPPVEFHPSPDYMWLLGYSLILKRYLLPILQEKGNFAYDGRYIIPGENAADIEEIIDFAFHRFADIPGTNRKAVLLQYGSGILLKGGLEKRNEERQLITQYAKKYQIDIIDTLDRLYLPEKEQELWFGVKNFSHHTPYGNRVVCEMVLHWLTKPSPVHLSSLSQCQSRCPKDLPERQTFQAGQGALTLASA